MVLLLTLVIGAGTVAVAFAVFRAGLLRLGPGTGNHGI
jgi:hypothetical protein